MGYAIGYLFTPFVISFLIVHFGICRRYEREHGEKYSVGKRVLFTILIGLGFFLLSAIG